MPRGGRFAKSFALNTTPLALVASALGCSLTVDPRSTQCDSDRQCAALVGNGRQARCAAGYCQLVGGGSSVSGAAGTLDAGRGQAGRSGEAGTPDTNGRNAGNSGSPSFGGAAGATADTGGEGPGTGGKAAGGSTGLGASGGTTGTGGASAGGSLGGAAGSAAGGSEGAPAAPTSEGDGDGDGVGAGGGDGVNFGGSAGQASSDDGASDGGTGGWEGSTLAKGVMVLTVPLATLGQGQRYNAHNTGMVESHDLAGATLTLRAYAPGATGGNLHVFCTSRNFADSAPTDIALSRLTDGFQDIDVPVPAPVPDGFQPTNVFIIRVEVEAGPGFGVSWQSPVTVVYIDSIISSNGAISDTFDTSPAFSTFGSSDTRMVPDSTLAWLPSMP
jgi:hypothetical protein